MDIFRNVGPTWKNVRIRFLKNPTSMLDSDSLNIFGNVGPTWLQRMSNYIKRRIYNNIMLSFEEQTRKIYKCEICEYETTKKYDFEKHLTTLKHNANAKVTTKLLECNNCGKIYKHRSSLWRHKKTCLTIKNDEELDDITINEENSYIDDGLIMRLIDENKELKNLLLEQARQTNEIKNIMSEMKENNRIICDNSLTTVNYNTNKTFNLNIFLNETCKNAMNLKDFMDSIHLELADLINVGEVGYIKGISDIITTNLNALSITDRPIHCSDGKREVLYIKDKDRWEKDEDKIKLKNLIRNVALKNQSLILKFKEKYPDCVLLDSQYCEQYNRLIIEAMGGNGDDDDAKEHKIMKNITKNITLDKQKILHLTNSRL